MNEPVFLLLDNGNSRLKWAVWRRKGEINLGSPLVTEGKIDLLDLERVFADLPRPSRVLVANVAGPEAEEKLAAFVLGRWRLKPEFVRSQAQGFGVQSGYRKPEALGVDRWLALVAVRNRYNLPALIADCGTALTVDLIDEAGRHRGGLICPGLKLMTEALVRRTQVRLESRLDPIGALGDHTAAAVYLGVRQAALGLIERVFFKYQAIYPSLSLILTGGDGHELSSHLQSSAQWAPNLVLEGLAVVGSW